MKIKKIEDRIEPKGQFDVELQGCLDDCTEYFSKTKAECLLLREHGFKADGSESLNEIRDIKEAYGFYCFSKKTAKDTNLW